MKGNSQQREIQIVKVYQSNMKEFPTFKLLKKYEKLSKAVGTVLWRFMDCK